MNDDTISRAAAIDALDVLCEEHRYKIPGKMETYSQYNEAWQDALDRAEGAIGNLPPAQPEPHWIPVSERLPKVAHSVLFSRRSMDTSEGCLQADGKWWQYRWNEILNADQVIAWMPLPEPYRAERRTDESD